MSLIQLTNPRGLYDPAPNGYSHVAAVQDRGVRWVFPAGQGGENEKGELAPDFGGQLRQALDNLRTALAAAGAGPADVARTLVMVVNHTEEHLHLLVAEFERFWGAGPKPACTLIPVQRLALDGMLVEIEATAAVSA
jgi:enamine deaminase RidA (YjgF/YER057c/UK114 family)